MFIISRNFLIKKLYNDKHSVQGLFEGVLNKVFNAVDEDRRMDVGPNRACAEWLLRNGASVKLVNQQEYLSDYNALPKEDCPITIIEVKAVESSISHYGFENFKGCNRISKVIFHKCNFLQNEAMQELSYLKNSLKYLQISSCPDITDNGLLYLQGLKLTTLKISNLPYVENKDTVLDTLKASLPNCNISFS
ncbi:hypothetical protein WA026_021008 [Henosepilachna vigintioctopunctata]|uniref:ATP synthase subunit s, mitochondrial n=1 Tax=Henosepilachna vigintioctopunctata TaxID=420089 RepID=A0AAW1VCZ5_9CUCU